MFRAVMMKVKMKGNFVSLNLDAAPAAKQLHPLQSQRAGPLSATISKFHCDSELVPSQSYNNNRSSIDHNEHATSSSGRSTSDASSAFLGTGAAMSQVADANLCVFPECDPSLMHPVSRVSESVDRPTWYKRTTVGIPSRAQAIQSKAPGNKWSEDIVTHH